MYLEVLKIHLINLKTLVKINVIPMVKLILSWKMEMRLYLASSASTLGATTSLGCSPSRLTWAFPKTGFK